MDTQFKKGILEMCILRSISRESKYGYDIIHNMREYFPEVNESTFYAILRRLNAEGAASVAYGEVSKGPVRKYYKITKQGILSLEKAEKDWNKLVEAVSAVGI